MARPSTSYFETLTKLVHKSLDTVTFERLDDKPDRVIWEAHGLQSNYHIRLKEIFNQSGRIYSYYVIYQGDVIIGFDNYPDRRALQEKHGPLYKNHLNTPVPHKHGFRKETLELTPEKTVNQFLKNLSQYIP